MFCPYCGSEILDNSKFCPDCGKAIKKEKDIPEEKPIYSEKENIYYDWVYNFLQENQGKAFTVKSLEERLDPYNEKDLGSLLQNILNKMRDDDIIESGLYEGETHYFFPEISTSTKYDYTEYKKPEIFDSAQKKQISRKSFDSDTLLAVAIIGGIIGIVLIIAGIPSIFNSPTTGITLIVIGIIIIAIMSGGKCCLCFYACEGCGDCDCDC